MTYRATAFRKEIMSTPQQPVLKFNRVELTPYFVAREGNRWLLYCPACLPALDSGGAAFEAVLHDARERVWRRRWGLA